MSVAIADQELAPGSEFSDHVEQSALNLPAEFWSSRAHLDHIRRAAHSRAMSADALLCGVLARVALMTSPTWTLPAIVVGPGSLDLMVATLGLSGTGKTGTLGACAEVLPMPLHLELQRTLAVGKPLSTGEGLGEAYIGTVQEPDPSNPGKTVAVRQQVLTGILFVLDEGQTLNETAKRAGQTVTQAIRTAWSGATLGQTNASADRTRHLPALSYRFVLVAAFQFEHAAGLLADVGGGTPQRFLFPSATDPSVPDEPTPWPGSIIGWTPADTGGGEVEVAQSIRAEIYARRVSRVRGQAIEGESELDSHRDLLRLKVAALLGILDNRTDVNEKDWALAGSVLDTSDRNRQAILDAAAYKRREIERAQTGRKVRENEAVELSAEKRALASTAKSIANHVHKGQCGPCKRSCAQRAMGGKYRGLVNVDDAIDLAVSSGWVTFTNGHMHPGQERPQ